MIENRELTMDDYLAMLRRRLKVLLIPTLLGPLIGLAVSYAFPARFTSQSLVLVEGQKVPQGYVAPVVTEDLTQRVVTLEQKALGADRLHSLIDKLNQQGFFRGTNSDQVIDEIRSGVAIQAVQAVLVPSPGTAKTPKQSEVPGFNVQYTTSNPREAQAVCAGLTDIILQENLKDREQVAQNTTDFLSRQVADAKRNLDDQDEKLAAFQKQYMGQLPGDQNSNWKMLETENTQLDATTQALARAQQDKTYTESLLAQQLSALTASQSATNPQTLQQQLSAAQTQLVELQGRYTDDYPDVVKTKKQIVDLQKRLNEMNVAAANPSTAPSNSSAVAESPEIQQLRLQIHQYDQVIAQATRQQKTIQDQIKLLQGRVALSPAVEEQYKALTRDYDTAQKFYNDLLADKSKSEMQTAMEHEQQGEQMRLQIPADLPDSPSFPNRLLFAGGGLGTGLALGFGLAMWLELRDKSMRSESDVIAALELPVLSQVPWVGTQLATSNGNGRRNFRDKSRSGSETKTIEA